MPRDKRPSFAEQAATALELSHATDPGDAATLRQEATVLAMLAIAEEVGKVRDSIGSVQMALEDQDGFGAGIHLHHISDWLERISKK